MWKIVRRIWFLLVLCIALAVGGCGAADEPQNVNTNDSINEAIETSDDFSNSVEIEEDKKILIAYFSRADENYGVGYVEKGNTAIIAEMIAEETGGELFHIERATPYPAEYDECTEEAKQEQNDDARPALVEDKDISEYDVIFLGYPIWWGEMPMPVYTFLEGHDFSGKKVIPFCTHAGSGLSGTVKSIESICADSEILDGLSIKGEDAQNSQDKAKETVKEWLDSLSY